MIKIAVRDIKSKGLDIDQTIPKEGIGLSDEEIDLRSPLQVKARLERVNDAVVAQTQVKAEFGYLCARCLEELHSEQTRDYVFDFEITPGMEFIDLGEEIRQELIIDNPARVLCAEGCKGICPKCGANLNKEQCQCST